MSRASRVSSWGQVALVGIGTIVAATLANVVVYFLGGTLIDYDPHFDILTSVSPTIAVTAEAGFVAVLLYAALLRFSRNPVRTFNIVAAVVFVVTLIPDLVYVPTVPGATTGQIATLVLMHIVAAAIMVPMLTTYARPRTR